MTRPSSIVFETIDSDFPVNGQDNDSQGFRDNFSIIKNGLASAWGDITSLNNNIDFSTSSETLASGEEVNLYTRISYFSNTTPGTATLSAGENGQLKTFISGDGVMVITVTNPGWAGIGNMTFNAQGQSCTMQYLNNKWFCIGNNGVTFS